MSCCQNTPTRRTVLAAGAATAAVTFAACSSEPEQEISSSGQLNEAVKLEELPPGSSVQTAVGGHQILIHRQSEQTVHAYSAVCSHQGCIVGATDDASEVFICPCHSSNFDKHTGEAVAGPAQLPLTRHQTLIQNGWVLVEVDST